MAEISRFVHHHFRHFNSAALVDAADAYGRHLDAGGLMFMTLAGAMSTGELGLSLAEMIRRGKVHAICCTGANLEEDIFNLVAHDHYVRIPQYRHLTAADEGQPVVVVNDDFVAQALGIDVGSTLTIRVDGKSYDFEVVGLAASGGFRFGPYDIPPGVIDGDPGFTLTVLSVSEENLNQALLDLSANPTLLALDLSFIDGLMRRVIDQFAAIPTVVGLLSLLAAAVAMANTVALATLERRRQIGVMKAVGLKGRRVMGILLLENTIIGVLGGLMGIGLSAAGVAVMTSFGDGTGIPIPADAAPVAVALMAAAVAIAWIATFASARSTVREHVTEVLRYE